MTDLMGRKRIKVGRNIGNCWREEGDRRSRSKWLNELTEESCDGEFADGGSYQQTCGKISLERSALLH